MSNSNINWSGNRVIDPNPSQSQTRRPASPQMTQTAPATQMTEMTESSQWTPPFSSTGLDTLGPVLPRTAGTGSTEGTPTREGPPMASEEGFIPSYLRRNIGRNVRCEFVVGTNTFVEKTGKLIEVGINFFVLEDVNSRTHIMCDLYSARFVTVIMFNS